MTSDHPHLDAAHIGEGEDLGSAVVVGAGGNIGSHMVPHLGRMPEIKRATLIDPDIYDAANLGSQNIVTRDVGRRKVEVQAERLRRINPRLSVDVFAEEIAMVPLGCLHSRIMLCCVDSRRARQTVNRMAWRLGIPFVDSGVSAGGMLARINVYVPGDDTPCLECPWGPDDYAAIEQTYPCADAAVVPATGAPSSLGALAGSLQALTAARLLSRVPASVPVGRQVLVDAASYRLIETAYRRNPNCRFDHEVWRIQTLPGSPRTGAVSELLEAAERGGAPVEAIRIEGDVFVKRVTCLSCGRPRDVMRFGRRLSAEQRKCRSCGGRMAAAGMDVEESLGVAHLAAASLLSKPLSRLGLRTGDVVSVVGRSRTAHLQIGDR
jgi:molybdopterin/thiamine biosynthesis adenylyltransferase